MQSITGVSNVAKVGGHHETFFNFQIWNTSFNGFTVIALRLSVMRGI